MATNSASSTPPIEKVIANIRKQTEIKVVATINDSDEETMIKTYEVQLFWYIFLQRDKKA